MSKIWRELCRRRWEVERRDRNAHRSDSKKCKEVVTWQHFAAARRGKHNKAFASYEDSEKYDRRTKQALIDWTQNSETATRSIVPYAFVSRRSDTLLPEYSKQLIAIDQVSRSWILSCHQAPCFSELEADEKTSPVSTHDSYLIFAPRTLSLVKVISFILMKRGICPWCCSCGLRTNFGYIWQKHRTRHYSSVMDR